MARGATVTVVAANVALPDPAGVEVVRVVSTEDLRREVLLAAADADAVVMAAAPADFRPATPVESKIKKTPMAATPRRSTSSRTPTSWPSSCARASSKRPVIVGFAAETGDANGSVSTTPGPSSSARAATSSSSTTSAAGEVFGRDDNEAVILGADGSVTPVALGPKIALAHAVWDAVIALPT